jgi:hypothetical protein
MAEFEIETNNLYFFWIPIASPLLPAPLCEVKTEILKTFFFPFSKPNCVSSFTGIALRLVQTEAANGSISEFPVYGRI